jgi:hypothetical protein
MTDLNPKVNFNRDVAKFLPRQMEVVKALGDKSKYILYGGAVGGGKSYLLRWVAAKLAMAAFAKHGIRGAQVMLACEDYPSLKDRQISKIVREFPDWLGKYHDDHKAYGKCYILSPEYGEGVICLRNLDDASKYQSAEFAAILVDELTKNPYQVFNDLRLRLRWPGIPDAECPFIGATNPGGIGHNYCKAFWIDKIYPPEFIDPVDMRPSFAFIRSTGDDNPYIDQAYWQSLSSLPEQLRKAFKEGSWEIFLGQAFEFSRAAHVIKELPIPKHAHVYTTFDWGFGAPFSWGWWWVDNDGRGYRFSEWYGWNGTPNQGLRWEDSRVADEIVKRESVLTERYDIDFTRAIRKAGPDCFQKKPDYKGGGQGPSTAEVFASKKIYLTPGDASRGLKLRQFRERLKIPHDEVTKLQSGLPMLLVYEECDQFIRTIPSISTHQVKMEEIDPKCEDHCFDEACHFCMARPVALRLPEGVKLLSDAHIDAVEKRQGDSYEIFAGEEQRQDQVWWDNLREKEGGYFSDVDGR